MGQGIRVSCCFLLTQAMVDVSCDLTSLVQKIVIR
jgi:hypothetical protein